MHRSSEEQQAKQLSLTTVNVAALGCGVASHFSQQESSVKQMAKTRVLRGVRVEKIVAKIVTWRRNE